jgi:hypothetical protein
MNKEVKKVILLWLLIPLLKIIWSIIWNTMIWWIIIWFFMQIILLGLLILPINIFTTLIILWYTPKNLKIHMFMRIISTLSLFAMSLWIWNGFYIPLLLFSLSLIIVYKVWYTPKNKYLSIGLSLISTVAFIVLIYLNGLGFLMSV